MYVNTFNHSNWWKKIKELSTIARMEKSKKNKENRQDDVIFPILIIFHWVSICFRNYWLWKENLTSINTMMSIPYTAFRFRCCTSTSEPYGSHALGTIIFFFFNDNTIYNALSNNKECTRHFQCTKSFIYTRKTKCLMYQMLLERAVKTKTRAPSNTTYSQTLLQY